MFIRIYNKRSKKKTIDNSKQQKQDITNFPKQGDDEKISLRNSKYRPFDVDYAEDLKKNWPQIWKKGGNIEGNNQYRRLLPIIKRKDKSAQTKTEEIAIKKREAWAARHIGNFRLAGVVAQIKWFVISERGQKYMKELINDEKKRLSRERNRTWNNWIQKKQAPAEKKLQRSIYSYLKSAQKRYKSRIKEYVTSEKNAGNYVIKSVVSWSELLSIASEVDQIILDFGPSWLAVWSLSGNEELDEIYSQLNETKPLNLTFGERDLAISAIDFAAYKIAQTSARNVKKIIEQGLLSGASTTQIAIAIDNAASFGFSRSVDIARTESTKAINLASNQSYQTAANQGINIQAIGVGE